MSGGAPRRLACFWQTIARGAVLGVALVAAGPALACVEAEAIDAMPGSQVVLRSGTGLVSSAWYEGPTDAYGHGIMGEVQDAHSLVATFDLQGACETARVDAGANHVFEDIAPRLSDVDGDGLPEVIAVRSSFSQGAQLIVYRREGTALVELAATPFIGRRNRWLAPAAWGDLDGDGAWEVAYVDRPHLAKILRIWRFESGRLSEVATASGVTNHRIGEPYISGGLRTCGGTPEIVLASADRLSLLALRYDGREVVARNLGPWTSTTVERAMACK